MRTRCVFLPWRLGAVLLALTLGACQPRYARTPLPPCHGRVLQHGWRVLADSVPGTDTIRGRVIDAVRWTPLADAVVSIAGMAHGARTDTAGAFTLPVAPVAPTGRVVLRIHRITHGGFVDSVAMAPGRGVHLHVWLDPEGGGGCPVSSLVRKKRWWEWP